MAGGSGTRLWPASNSKKPKQFLSIPGDQSFFDAALERAFSVIDMEGNGKVIIIAGIIHIPHVIEACGRLNHLQLQHVMVIPEPFAKNTAPALCCGAYYLEKTFQQDRLVLVLTSDHIIKPLDHFVLDAKKAAEAAAKKNLTVFGIKPRSAETGYGYIESSNHIAEGTFAVSSFREKPDQQTAESYVKAGNFFWNTGMFAYSNRFMLEEINKYTPESSHPFSLLKNPDEKSFSQQNGITLLSSWEGLEKAYQDAKAISFDYALTEKCSKVVMIAASFEWYDVGSWDEYARLTKDEKPDAFQFDAENNYVNSDIPVAICGANDLIVVVRSGKDGSPASVLISQKGKSQQVKNIVDQMKTQGRTELL
jgi:mannose-1-phosphate guanylyltransferase/mannose-1-phosphate guanylyltransferase/mannose-6-phosphate isomerase